MDDLPGYEEWKPHMSKEGLCYERSTESDLEFALVMAPLDFDVKNLIGETVVHGGSREIILESDSATNDAAPDRYEVHTSSGGLPNMCLLLPSVDQRKHVLGPYIAGQIKVIRCVQLPHIRYPKPNKKASKVEKPDGLRARWKPFGYRSPKKVQTSVQPSSVNPDRLKERLGPSLLALHKSKAKHVKNEEDSHEDDEDVGANESERTKTGDSTKRYAEAQGVLKSKKKKRDKDLAVNREVGVAHVAHASWDGENVSVEKRKRNKHASDDKFAVTSEVRDPCSASHRVSSKDKHLKRKHDLQDTPHARSNDSCYAGEEPETKKKKKKRSLVETQVKAEPVDGLDWFVDRSGSTPATTDRKHARENLSNSAGRNAVPGKPSVNGDTHLMNSDDKKNGKSFKMKNLADNRAAYDLDDAVVSNELPADRAKRKKKKKKLKDEGR